MLGNVFIFPRKYLQTKSIYLFLITSLSLLNCNFSFCLESNKENDLFVQVLQEFNHTRSCLSSQSDPKKYAICTVIETVWKGSLWRYESEISDFAKSFCYRFENGLLGKACIEQTPPLPKTESVTPAIDLELNQYRGSFCLYGRFVSNNFQSFLRTRHKNTLREEIFFKNRALSAEDLEHVTELAFNLSPIFDQIHKGIFQHSDLIQVATQIHNFLEEKLRLVPNGARVMTTRLELRLTDTSKSVDIHVSPSGSLIIDFMPWQGTAFHSDSINQSQSFSRTTDDFDSYAYDYRHGIMLTRKNIHVNNQSFGTTFLELEQKVAKREKVDLTIGVPFYFPLFVQYSDHPILNQTIVVMQPQLPFTLKSYVTSVMNHEGVETIEGRSKFEIAGHLVVSALTQFNLLTSRNRYPVSLQPEAIDIRLDENGLPQVRLNGGKISLNPEPDTGGRHFERITELGLTLKSSLAPYLQTPVVQQLLDRILDPNSAQPKMSIGQAMEAVRASTTVSSY